MIPIIISTLVGFFSDASAQRQCIHQFLGLTPWYQYLTLRHDCSINLGPTGLLGPNSSGLSIANLNQFWLIAMALVDDLFKVGGVVAVAMIIYGGFRYITSQGQPDNIKGAWSTIWNAMIGLTICIVAVGLVDFLGNQLGGTSTTNGLPNIVANASTLTTVLNIVFGVIGLLAVVYLLYGSFKYVTSGGEGQSTAEAKDTILFAIIGLAVAFGASLIVNVLLVRLG